jgi:hypothetical protein
MLQHSHTLLSDGESARFTLTSSLLAIQSPIILLVSYILVLRRGGTIYAQNYYLILTYMVGEKGIEPLPLARHGPKPCAYASSATRPFYLTIRFSIIYGCYIQL